jgi:hypothetical protein
VLTAGQALDFGDPECEPWVDPPRIDHQLHPRGRNGSSRHDRDSLAR